MNTADCNARDADCLLKSRSATKQRQHAAQPIPAADNYPKTGGEPFPGSTGRSAVICAVRARGPCGSGGRHRLSRPRNDGQQWSSRPSSTVGPLLGSRLNWGLMPLGVGRAAQLLQFDSALESLRLLVCLLWARA